MNLKRKLYPVLLCLFCLSRLSAQDLPANHLRRIFQSPPPSASPWVFWYWLQASVSREGITADLEAMKQAGIGGAFLMPIKGPANPPLMDSVVEQLSPSWWAMVAHAFHEARRLGLRLGIHVSDGFALAGGPWITPDLSMQKLVWTEKTLEGGKRFDTVLDQPETLEHYYRDIAVFAFPSAKGAGITTRVVAPRITSSTGDPVASLLTDPANQKNFSSEAPCWIQYAFSQPFTCRSVTIRSRNNYQSNRLLVQASEDGKIFTTVARLQPPRHGWQDIDADYTHALPSTTARFFRFVYDPVGSEPGAEDLDAAKWKQSLKLSGLELSSEARIDQFEGKNGEVWRISGATSPAQVPDSLCLPSNRIIDITARMDASGRLMWQAPPGQWTILRIGHTSTGHRNETAGGGKGLECDKFNPVAVTLQFNKWFGAFYQHVDAPTIHQVLQFLHVDSWECGSQNWSPVFRSEFRKRRGYDLYPYLPVIAGIPVGSADSSERVLHDVRQTIAELVNDKFYVTLSRLAHGKGVELTAESVAPTMESDGMLHYKTADIPMGEFWLRSPTHDKPNDMLDAISGGHIYGKNIIQAEGFTELRMAWDEYPGMLKTLADRNFALGINRLVYHVFTHNPWMDRKPGMTLDQIGLYFQRDQTWWKQARAWVDYARRCQALLQFGQPVTDIAVFTGDDFPRRSILPDRLVPVLPGIFGQEVVESEERRLKNEGLPLVQLPPGVSHSANMTDAGKWIDPLHGYAYDSYNADALLRLFRVRNGKVELATGPRYRLLILPGVSRMTPDTGLLSAAVALKMKALTEQGATVLINQPFTRSPGLYESRSNDRAVRETGRFFHADPASGSEAVKSKGKGRVVQGPYRQASFSSLGIEPDFLATDLKGGRAAAIAWTHRAGSGTDVYFISNQKDTAQIINLSLRVKGKIPELWDPVNGEIRVAKTWRMRAGRTELPVLMERNASLFVVLKQHTVRKEQNEGRNWVKTTILQPLKGPWTVRFDTALGGPRKPVRFLELSDWTDSKDSSIRYYSGTAAYTEQITYQEKKKERIIWLNLGEVDDLAEVVVNGINCGTVWTAPYRIDISKAIRPGVNTIRINVVNTWNNRLVGDSKLPLQERITRTMYPFKMEGRPLLPAGLKGPVLLEFSESK